MAAEMFVERGLGHAPVTKRRNEIQDGMFPDEQRILFCLRVKHAGFCEMATPDEFFKLNSETKVHSGCVQAKLLVIAIQNLSEHERQQVII